MGRGVHTRICPILPTTERIDGDCDELEDIQEENSSSAQQIDVGHENFFRISRRTKPAPSLLPVSDKPSAATRLSVV